MTKTYTQCTLARKLNGALHTRTAWLESSMEHFTHEQPGLTPSTLGSEESSVFSTEQSDGRSPKFLLLEIEIGWNSAIRFSSTIESTPMFEFYTIS